MLEKDRLTIKIAGDTSDVNERDIKIAVDLVLDNPQITEAHVGFPNGLVVTVAVEDAK